MSILLLSDFVLFPWCTTYSDPSTGRRKTDLHPTTGRKRNDLDPMMGRKKNDLYHTTGRKMMEEVGVKRIQNFGVGTSAQRSSQSVFGQSTGNNVSGH